MIKKILMFIGVAVITFLVSLYYGSEDEGIAQVSGDEDDGIAQVSGYEDDGDVFSYAFVDKDKSIFEENGTHYYRFTYVGGYDDKLLTNFLQKARYVIRNGEQVKYSPDFEVDDLDDMLNNEFVMRMTVNRVKNDPELSNAEKSEICYWLMTDNEIADSLHERAVTHWKTAAARLDNYEFSRTDNGNDQQYTFVYTNSDKLLKEIDDYIKFYFDKQGKLCVVQVHDPDIYY